MIIETANNTRTTRRPTQDEIKQNIQYYYKKENKKLLRTYGREIYRYSMELDVFSSIPDPLKNHAISPKFRIKLVDWLFEVFFALSCSESTIYLTIHLLDGYLFRSKKKILDEDLHLLGVVCLFIASKNEDLSPLFMHDLRSKICHGRFSDKDIKNMERLILNTFNFVIFIHSMGDFIHNHFYEFKITNKEPLSNSNLLKNFIDMEVFAIYISKVILHSEEFAPYKNSIKSISCIVIAYEIIKTQRKLSDSEEKIFKKWILGLIEGSQFDPDEINNLYNVIAEYYTNFQTMKISHNLMKLTELPL